MCRFRSAVAVYNQDTETIELKFGHFDDSHTNIREIYNIRDDSPLYKHTSLEYVPYGALDDFSMYKLVFDDFRPDWWTEEMTTSAVQQFQANVTKMLKRKYWGYLGHLSLCYVTSIPAGMRFNVGGCVDLHSLTNIPSGTSFNVSWGLYLDSVVTIGELVKLSADRVCLNSLVDTPKNVTVHANNLYFGFAWQGSIN